jgi:transposase
MLAAAVSGSSNSPRNVKRPEGEARGPVLDMLRDLLTEGAHDKVIGLVSQLLQRNGELETPLAKRGLSAGNASEGITREQLALFLHAIQEEADEALQQSNGKLEQASQAPSQPDSQPKPPRQPPVRRAPPDNLRRVDNRIVVPKDERACPQCGKERKCIGHDETEVIELIPAEVIVRIDSREVLACGPCEGELARAPLGDKVISGGIYGSALVSTLFVRKYDHGMTLQRQREELLRMGLEMPSASMSDQIAWITDLLCPIWHELQDRVLHSRIMQLDSTSLPVRDKEHGFSIQLGSLCAYVGDQETVAYLYGSTGRKNGQRVGELGPEDFLALRSGPTLADASNVFDKSFLREDLIELGCNMHARRYFVKALDSGDTRAALPLSAFKRIYDIEEEAAALSEQARTLVRQQKSRPIYDELLSWCRTHQLHGPPKSPLMAACAYLINHHIALMRFLDDGAFPIDNGLVERLHRRPAIGRRNFLFVGSHAGGERAAIAYSILSTCRLLGLNPVAYLGQIVPTLARGVRRDELVHLIDDNYFCLPDDNYFCRSRVVRTARETMRNCPAFGVSPRAREPRWSPTRRSVC